MESIMSKTLSRREREFRAREQLILKTARGLIQEQGFLDLKMSQLAEAVEYSVGTLYSHFETKEDILVALAVQSIKQRARLFKLVSQAERSSRDRIYGILIARLVLAESDPDTFDIERLASSPSIWKHAAEKRYAEMVTMEQRCSRLVSNIIKDAFAAGDLTADQLCEADIIFGLWSITVGFHRLVQSFDDASQVGLANPHQAVKTNYRLLLDGYGWQPVTAWDGEAVELDFRQNIFD
jgi:AcrR family transcriptional regulator